MKYFVRSVKYFVALCVLCAVLMVLMLVTGTSQLTAEETLYLLFHSDRFVLLAVAVVVLALSYPKFGFIVRRMEGDLVNDRTQIETAFRNEGFCLVREENGVLYFRGENFIKRLTLLFEDDVTVHQEGEELVIDGIRRGVARVVYRLGGYLQMVHRDEK